MSWRRAAAALVRLAPAAAEAVPASQGLPALAAALRHHAMLPALPSAHRTFASSALQQQAEAAVAEDSTWRATPPADLPPQYSVVGRVASQYSVAPKRVFAVVEVGGCQFKVTPDDVIVTEKLRGVDVNDTLQLPRVLLLGSEEQTVIGRPFVPEAYVTAAVEVGWAGRTGRKGEACVGGSGGNARRGRKG